jgi:hypothetical protein
MQSIVVRDATGALSGAQMGISVSSAAFTGFKLSVPLATDSKGHMLVTAGDAIPLTVRAQDQFGNLVAGYNDIVTFTSTDSKAGLPAAYIFTAADAGAHTFSVDLKTTTPNSVVWSFSVVGALNAATLATITNFEVVNAAAASFELSVPSKVTAGTPFSLKVSVLDAFGNRVKNYFGTVRFTNTAGVIGLPADYSFNSIDAGDHTVTVTLNTLGSQTLSVADTVNAGLNTMVTVNVAAPSGGGGGGGKNAA